MDLRTRAAGAKAWLQQRRATIVRYGLIIVLIFIGFAGYSRWQMEDESRAFSVVQEWNGAIARLGVQPLYPAQEDFRVGDVYAVLVARDRPNVRWSDRAIMLGHVNLDEEILMHQSARSRPIPMPGEEVAGWYLTSGETSGIALGSIVFPRFDGGLDTLESAGFSLPRWLGGAQTRRTQDQRVQIGDAMTYGIDPSIALVRLFEFCENTQMCSRQVLRPLFKHRYGSIIFAGQEPEEELALDVRIVSRVFLTTNIVLDASSIGSYSAELSAPGDQDTGNGSDSQLSLRATGDRRQAISHDGRLLRPVVFGYHHMGLSALD